MSLIASIVSSDSDPGKNKETCGKKDKQKRIRLQKIDILRGLALFGMSIYHLSWDLAYFGYLPGIMPASGVLFILARVVAGSFLFLAGFSLFLVHGKGFHSRAFCHRFLLITVCAALVSVTTWLFVRQHFVYFGILHELALASLAGLLFLRTPLWLNTTVIMIFLLMPEAGFNFVSPSLWWLGLSRMPAPSFDYVPFFPWFACALAGQTIASIMTRRNWLNLLKAGIKPVFLSRLLQFFGRHSLIFYLIHQPILLCILFLFAQYLPPSYTFARSGLEQDCTKTCVLQADELSCRRFCSCVFDKLTEKNLLGAYIQGYIPLESKSVTQIRQRCLTENFSVRGQ